MSSSLSKSDVLSSFMTFSKSNMAAKFQYGRFWMKVSVKISNQHFVTLADPIILNILVT